MEKEPGPRDRQEVAGEFAVTDINTISRTPLEARSPFELRVTLGK